MTQTKENNRPLFPEAGHHNRKACLTAIGYFWHIGVLSTQTPLQDFCRTGSVRKMSFISGTDCYGSPISEHYRQLVEQGETDCSIEEFVEHNHKLQKEVLDKYYISLNLFSASGLGRAKEIHAQVSQEVFNRLYENGYLVKSTTSQFYDTELEVFLNGRQVVDNVPLRPPIR